MPHFALHLLNCLAILSTTAHATTHTVASGLNPLTYTPNTTLASINDTIIFTFYPVNHNVVSGPFSTPCQSADDDPGFYSDYVPSKDGVSNITFQILITDTQPIWFYCSQPFGGGHCTNGMVGVINPPPNSDETLENYALAARDVSDETYTQPDEVQGGVLVDSGMSTNTVSSSSLSASMSTSKTFGNSTISTATSSSSSTSTETGDSTGFISPTTTASFTLPTTASTGISGASRVAGNAGWGIMGFLVAFL